MPPKNQNAAKAKKIKKIIKKDINALTKGKGEQNVMKTLERVAMNVNRLPKGKKRADVLNSRVFQQLEEWIKGYVVLSQDTPPLPSPFEEHVQVHNLKVDFPIPIQYMTSDGFISFMTQPNFDKFLRIAIPGTAQATVKDDKETNPTSHSVDVGRTPSLAFLSADKSITTSGIAGGSTELAATSASFGTAPANAFHWSNNRKAWQPGLRIYPIGSIVSGSEPLVRFKNPSNETIEAQAYFWAYDDSETNLSQITSAWISCTNGTHDLPFTANAWNNVIVPDYGITAYFAWGVALRKTQAQPDPIPEMPSGLELILQQGQNHMVFGSPLVWRDFGVLDVCCKDDKSRLALQSQHEIASHIKFGLYEITVKNATPEIAKGGLISSAQFSGGTHPSAILKNPRTLFPYLATIQNNSSDVMNFDDGQHYFYIPEKEQDWYFKLVTDDEFVERFLEHDVPKIVTGIFAPPAIGFTVPFVNLTGMVHYEFLTRDLSATQQKCPGNSMNQIEQLLKALRMIPQFTENPKHLAKIGNAIKSLVTSPTFKKIAMDLAMTGLTLLI